MTLLALVVTLAPVAVLANHSQEVVASQNTTTAEFNSADVLENVTVAQNNVSLLGSVLIDGFEDGDIAEWSGDTDNFSATSTTSFSGSWSMQFDGAAGTSVSVNRDLGSTTPENISFSVNDSVLASVGPNPNTRFREGTTGGPAVIIGNGNQGTSDAGSVLTYDGSYHDTGLDITADTWFEIELYNIDYGANTYDLALYDANGNLQGTDTGNNFINSLSGIDNFMTSGESGKYYLDDFRATDSDGGQYEANHTVEDATTAKVNLSLQNAEADVTVTDPVGGQTLGSGTFSTDGNKSISLSGQTSTKVRVNVTVSPQAGTSVATMHDESILFDAQSPTVDNSTATPTGDLSAFQNTYTIDVNDTDFPLAQGDSVTAELFIDGSSEGTDTLTSNGTASVTATTNTGGAHTYNWTVTDSYGLSHTSQDFTVNIPATIEIFNETSPQTKISGQGDITVRSFAEDTVIENTTSTGEIDMTGFPVDQEFVVKVSLDTYHDTTVVFDDIYQQQKIWLLNSSLDTNQVRFTLTDNTGDFQDDPKLLIERPLNHTGANTTWEVIRADYFGAAGFTTDLETDTRYRLTVEAVDGAQRSVGPYTTSIDETVPLTIGSGRLNLTTGADSYTFNATYENVSGTEQIRWGFADPDGLTTDLNVTIYEYQNASNRIYSQTFSDPSDLIATQILTGNQPNLTWTVDWQATRDGETIGGEKTVGRFINEQASALPAWLQEAVAIVVLMLTAGAFSQRNFAAGAVVVALMGGVFWMGGWLTGVTSGAGVAGALALAVLYKWARDVR